MESEEVATAHSFAERRWRRYAWRFPVAAAVLGLATAALAWPTELGLLVVLALHLYGLLVLVGVPARAGVVPRRDDSRSTTLTWIICVVVSGAPALATVGPRWLAFVAGGAEFLLIIAYGRAQLTTDVAALSEPPRVGPTHWAGFVAHVVRTTWFTPLAVLTMGAGAIGLVLGEVAAALVYYPAAILLGAAALRAAPRHVVTAFVLALGAPWLAYAPHSLLAAGTVALIVMVAVAITARAVRSAA